MLLRYALYERKSPGGYQWTWRFEDLKDTLLDDFYYRIQMPDNANTIQPTHLRGGIEKFSQVQGSKLDVHLVFYRFYDGGSDEGRSRVTMLTAWANADQLPALSTANEVLELFRNPIFEDILKKSQTIGIEQPYSLTSNEPFPAKEVVPSADLAEFPRGLTDASNDYSLMIHDDNQTVQKYPSEAFNAWEAQRLNTSTDITGVAPSAGLAEFLRGLTDACNDYSLIIHNDNLKVQKYPSEIFKVWEADCLKEEEQRKEEEPLKEEEQRKEEKPLKDRVVPPVSVIIALGRRFLHLWRPFLSTQVLSPTDEVLDRFKKLPSSSQNKVLDKLSIIVNGKR